MQHLIIDGCSDKEYLRTIVSSYPNVRNLAVHLPLYKGVCWELRYLLPVRREMPHLSCLTVPFLGSYDECLAQTFWNLTHLDIVLPFPRYCTGRWEILTHLTKLTHISVGRVILVEHVLKLLLCPLLKILIVVPRGSSPYHAPYSVDNNRLVLLETENYDDRIFDWEGSANEGMDSRDFAELVVRARVSEYSFRFLFTWFLVLKDWIGKYFLTSLPKWIPRTFD